MKVGRYRKPSTICMLKFANIDPVITSKSDQMNRPKIGLYEDIQRPTKKPTPAEFKN
jgi:hypothetical protein